jgi:DNA modification methylase
MSPIATLNAASNSLPGLPDLFLQVVYQPLAQLRFNPRSARTHSKKQIAKLADAIRRFGFTNPIIVDSEGMLIAGHARLAAARLLQLAQVPTLCLDHMSEAEKRAYVIADNKLAELAGWDRDLLAVEFEALIELEFDVALTGFELPEIDLILDEHRAAGPGDEESVPPPPRDPVTRPGDVWQLGPHRLICANALDASSYAALLADERVSAVFTDPPYNVPIQGHVSGLGRHQHREFAFASGEMSKEAFTSFLRASFTQMANYSREGAIHFICMDWRHIGEVLAAAEGIYDEFKNLCVWNKDNGGMGSLYRSKHELVFVFKKGRSPHTNNVELGRHGRNRTNVWDYAGQNTFHKDRAADLAAHPTVKPVALVADALLDVTGRGELVLDPFGGSGTTILAAERTGRLARAVELDPAYVDLALGRYAALTGQSATLVGTGQTFSDVAAQRQADAEIHHAS